MTTDLEHGDPIGPIALSERLETLEPPGAIPCELARAPGELRMVFHGASQSVLVLVIQAAGLVFSGVVIWALVARYHWILRAFVLAIFLPLPVLFARHRQVVELRSSPEGVYIEYVQLGRRKQAVFEVSDIEKVRRAAVRGGAGLALWAGGKEYAFGTTWDGSAATWMEKQIQQWQSQAARLALPETEEGESW